MYSEKNCLSSNSYNGLEELYTDFDAWISKRSWKYRQRTVRTVHEITLEDKAPSQPETTVKTVIIDYQDCIVNGILHRQAKSDSLFKDVKALARFGQNGEDLVYLDFVLVRLVRDNGRRRIMFVNRSKL